MFEIKKQQWQDFTKLLRVLREDCTDLVIKNNKVCQYNDLMNAAYYIENIIHGQDDFEMIINNIRTVLPIFKLFEDSDFVYISVDDVNKIYTVTDKTTDVNIKFTSNVNNITTDEDNFKLNPVVIRFKVPIKVISRLKGLSDNFQTANFSITQTSENEVSIFMESLAKSRTSKLFSYKFDDSFDFEKEFGEKSLLFNSISVLTFWKLITKLKRNEDGEEVEEALLEDIEFVVGKVNNKPVLLLEFDSLTNHHIKVICKKVANLDIGI